MFYSALSTAVTNIGGAFSYARLVLAGQMVIIGMGMVFAVLAILWGVLLLFKLIFARPEPKKKVDSTPAAVAPAAVTPVAVTPVAEPIVVAQEADDGELIAVITAAVAAYIASEEPEAYQGGFKVVSFRRENGGRSWNLK